jgi:putative sterol carrier protein
MCEMPTVKQIFDEIPKRFDPDAARGLNAVIQFSLSGEGGGNYHAIIKDGTIDVREGSHQSPHMTLSMSGDDYVDLATGKLNAQMAFMTGKLRIAGDMGLAVKMQSLIRVG